MGYSLLHSSFNLFGEKIQRCLQPFIKKYKPLYDDYNDTSNSNRSVFMILGAKRVAWPPPQEGVLDPAELAEQNAVQSQVRTLFKSHK